MLKPEVVKELLLDELRAKGYSPNPADVGPAVSKLMELVKESEDKVIADSKKAPETSQKPS